MESDHLLSVHWKEQVQELVIGTMKVSLGGVGTFLKCAEDFFWPRNGHREFSGVGVGWREEHKWRRQASLLLGTFFKFGLKPRDCTFVMAFHQG